MQIFKERNDRLLPHVCAGIVTFLFVMLLLLRTEGKAHALEHRILDIQDQSAVEFYYSDGSPVSYAQVKIWSPEDSSIEFQNGRSDRNGRFAFIPNSDGLWRIMIKDGMGHAGSVNYERDAFGEQKRVLNRSNKGKTNSQTILALLGVSLILNMGFFLRMLQKMKQSPR